MPKSDIKWLRKVRFTVFPYRFWFFRVALSLLYVEILYVTYTTLPQISHRFHCIALLKKTGEERGMLMSNTSFVIFRSLKMWSQTTFVYWKCDLKTIQDCILMCKNRSTIVYIGFAMKYLCALSIFRDKWNRNISRMTSYKSLR